MRALFAYFVDERAAYKKGVRPRVAANVSMHQVAYQSTDLAIGTP